MLDVDDWSADPPEVTFVDGERHNQLLVGSAGPTIRSLDEDG